MDLSDSSYAFLTRILRCRSLRVCDNDLEDHECHAFWTSDEIAKWFKAHGYTPYRRNSGEEWPGMPSLHTSPSLPYEIFQEADYPYAYHNAQAESHLEPSLKERDFSGRVMYAQDRRLRHVAIKALHIKSREYRVIHFLSQQSCEVMRESCLLPVIELLYFREACFVEMPRWGSEVLGPHCRTMREILRIMQCVLKGLAFLHSHNIMHRDISLSNILVNHFGNDSRTYWPARVPQLSSGLLSYALIDFDMAIMLPDNVDRKTYRLSYKNALVGSGGPGDVAQGEFDYDPFAYDVGCLGLLFSERFQHHTRDIPLLAPLLDKMLTRNIKGRFTAEKALRFVERILIEAEPAQLSTMERPSTIVTYKTYDRWQGFPTEFQKKWAEYREPVGVPLTSRLLRAIVHNRILPRSTVPTIRRLFSRNRITSSRTNP